MTFNEWWETYKDTSSAVLGRSEFLAAGAAWEAADREANKIMYVVGGQVVGVHYNPQEFHEGQP